MKVKELPIIRTVYEEELKCPACLWEHTVFYRLGKESIMTPKELKEGRYGDGNCAECFLGIFASAKDLVLIAKQILPTSHRTTR